MYLKMRFRNANNIPRPAPIAGRKGRDMSRDIKIAQEEKTQESKLYRRGFLQLSSMTVAAPLLSRSAEGANSTDSTTLLGGFETDLNGWQTNGGNELVRVTDEQFSGAVTQGSRGLAVDTDGDPFPMIENKTRVRKADFVDAPYLAADVLPVVEGIESDVIFQFRYHHGDTPASTNGGKKNENGNDDSNNGNGEKPVLVVESPKRRVRQFSGSRIYWDMTGIDEAKRAEPHRLELMWYPADHPPNHGPRGRGSGFDYKGITLIDHIHLSSDPSDIDGPALSNTLRDLRMKHGALVAVETETLTDDAETGQFVYTDGFEIAYAFRIVTPDKFIYTVGNDEFKLGSGWSA